MDGIEDAHSSASAHKLLSASKLFISLFDTYIHIYIYIFKESVCTVLNLTSNEIRVVLP